VPDKVIENLIGDGSRGFRKGAAWPDQFTLFHANRDWFAGVASLTVFQDAEEWLDRAPELRSFVTHDILARSEARHRYLNGESVYILHLERTVKPLRELCDELASDLAISPANVSVQAWAAGGPTSVAMHYDLDFNFNLQIAGKKEWRSAVNDLVANPISSYFPSATSGLAVESGCEMPTEMPADAQTVIANPGDVVWLPQGVWHATRTAEPTVAMAFVIQPPTWADHVAQVVRDRLHEEARWRERVVGGCDRSRHGALRARAREALIASRAILADVGPSEMLYRSLWGQKPAYFKRRDDVTDSKLDPSSGVLVWRQRGERHEMTIPDWARAAVARMVQVNTAWSVAVMHDLVGNDDAVFLNVEIMRLSEAGFLEPAPTAAGGVAREKRK
jgi:cupin superfamily protein